LRRSHEILTELESKGELKVLVNAGVLSPCVLSKLTLFRYVDARIKTGSKSGEAILDAEIQFKVCKATVYNAIKYFK